MKSLVFAALAIGFILLGIYITFDYLFSRQCGPVGWPTTTFSREAWTRASPEMRYELVNSLIDSGILKRATRDAVIAELGEPPKKAADGKYFVYHIRTFRDSACLLSSYALLDISFDASGRVSDMRVYAD